MYKLNDLLDTAKTKNDIPSDYKLSDYLGVSKQSISKYRKGYGLISNTTAIRLSELCELKPELVISSICAQRAETSEEKTIWQHFYKMAAAAAIAGVSLSAAVSAPVATAEASTIVNVSHEAIAINNHNINKRKVMYIMSSICCELHEYFTKSVHRFTRAFFQTSTGFAFC